MKYHRYFNYGFIFFLIIFAEFGDIHCQINGAPPITDGKIVLQLYQLMKDVHEVLTFKRIEYWVLAGTLLGAVRHQGIIPWDDDLDICINKKQFNVIYSLKPIFNRMGYEIVPWGSGYKIFPQDGVKVYSKVENGVEKYFKFPFLDVFFFEQKGNDIIYGWNYFKQPRNNREVAIYANELFPLKKYKFGDFVVVGPNDPLKYLFCCYGSDCLNVAFCNQGHSSGGGGNNITVSLDEKYKQPAVPLGPLGDNFSKILPELFSLETIKISPSNLNQFQNIAKKICRIYIDAFKKEYEFLLKNDHPNEYRTLTCRRLGCEDVLFEKFNKMIEVFTSQIDFFNGSYISILKNYDGEVVGYIIFVRAPIEQVIESMISRKYIVSIVSPLDIFNNNNTDDLYILSLAIEPEFQGLGLGKRLIFSAKNERVDAKRIYLLTMASEVNADTQNFYEHLKFNRVGMVLTSDNNEKILYGLKLE